MFQRFLAWCGGLFQALLGLLVPLIGPPSAKLISRPVFILLQIVVVALIVAALYFVGEWLELHKRIWINYPRLAHWWLPILFLILFALSWLSYFLWKELTRDDLVSEFPDIDEAWAAAVIHLRRSRIDLQDYPIFLVLGQPEGDDDLLFQTAGIPLKVRRAPAPDAPIRVSACMEPKREAIYITCPDASVLSRRAIWLNRVREGFSGSHSSVREHDDSSDDPTRTRTPEQEPGTMFPAADDDAMGKIMEILPRAEKGGGFHPVHKRVLRQIERERRRSELPGHEVERQQRRLEHLCRLVRRDLAPRCPINGVLVLIPFSGTDSNQDAGYIAEACERDLKTTRLALGMHCPVYAVVCDMESAPGFTEFITYFKPRERLSRIGQRFPFCPGLTSTGPDRGRSETASIRGLLRGLAAWVCTGFMRRWIYEKCQLEKQPEEDVTKVYGDNARLFLLLCELQERQRQLGTILGDGFSSYAPVHQLLFGGCYLAATGESPEHRAFLADVLNRMLEEDKRSILYWTDETLIAEDQMNRWINIGWTVLAVLLVLGVGGVFALTR